MIRVILYVPVGINVNDNGVSNKNDDVENMVAKAEEVESKRKSVPFECQ